MNCTQTLKFLNTLEFSGENPKLSAEVQAHLDRCPDCREEYRTIQEARDLFADLTPVEPAPSFGPAWRERLHEVQAQEMQTVKMRSGERQHRLNLPLGWPRWVPALGFAMVIILFLGLGMANHWGMRPDTASVRDTDLASQSAGSYRLKIVSVGSQSKVVQRVIRDFRSSYEGGAAYTYRDPGQDLTVFEGLTWRQARTLKLNLEKAGAVVKMSADE